MSRASTDPEQRRLRGQRIFWARQFVEPNRYEFARMLKADPSTIRNIENGSRSPSLEMLQRICATLRISIDYVLKGKLTGVDPELAALLAGHHPELIPAALPLHRLRQGQHPSVSHYAPTTPEESFA